MLTFYSDKYSTMGPEPHSVPDPEVPVVTNLTLRNKKEPEKESHPEIDQASSEGKDPEVSIAAELSTDESEEEAGAIPSDWIEINHYGSSPLYKKKYGDTLDARADIIDAVYILILEIGVPQLIVIIDLLYQRLCSEKVPGEFFPFRESVWHMLFLSKKELMRDESVAKNRKVDERFKLGTFVSGVESEIQNLKVNETLPIGTLVSGVESPVLGMRGREEKWISDDLRCHQG